MHIMIVTEFKHFKLVLLSDFRSILHLSCCLVTPTQYFAISVPVMIYIRWKLLFKEVCSIMVCPVSHVGER